MKLNLNTKINIRNTGTNVYLSPDTKFSVSYILRHHLLPNFINFLTTIINVLEI
jgi:hypothetical protein